MKAPSQKSLKVLPSKIFQGAMSAKEGQEGNISIGKGQEAGWAREGMALLPPALQLAHRHENQLRRDAP